jgi:hypothetical protein
MAHVVQPDLSNFKAQYGGAVLAPGDADFATSAPRLEWRDRAPSGGHRAVYQRLYERTYSCPSAGSEPPPFANAPSRVRTVLAVPRTRASGAQGGSRATWRTDLARVLPNPWGDFAGHAHDRHYCWPARGRLPTASVPSVWSRFFPSSSQPSSAMVTDARRRRP